MNRRPYFILVCGNSDWITHESVQTEAIYSPHSFHLLPPAPECVLKILLLEQHLKLKPNDRTPRDVKRLLLHGNQQPYVASAPVR